MADDNNPPATPVVGLREQAMMNRGGVLQRTAQTFLDEEEDDEVEMMDVGGGVDIDPSIIPGGASGGGKHRGLYTIHSAFLRIYQYRGKSSVAIEQDIDSMLSLTAFMPRYAGFLYNFGDIPNYVDTNGGGIVNKKAYHMREQVYIQGCRTKQLLGIIVYRGICDVFMHLVNSSPSGVSTQEVRKVVGAAFSAMEVASRCLLIMSNGNYTPSGKDSDRLYGRGEMFGALFSLSRCLYKCKYSIDKTSTSIRAYVVDMCRYLNAFGTALLRVLIKHEDSLRNIVMGSLDTFQNSDIDRVRIATQYALLKCVQNINKMATGGTKQSIPMSSVCSHRVMMDILLKYDTLTRSKMTDEGVLDTTYLSQDTKMMLAQCKSIYDINSILDRLAADCRSTDYDIMSGLMPGHCDTNFPTIKSEMPCSTVVADGGSAMMGAAASVGTNENLMHNIVDPATSTSLYMHNMMILDSQDTIPVFSSNHNYFKLKTMNAKIGQISALPLIVHGLNGETKSREERYFYQHNAHTKDMQNFYIKGCSVSPSNISLFMRCLNFEMMDSHTFSTIVEAMKACDGLPRPSDMALALLHSRPCLRMAMNIFYQHYMSETTETNPVIHCWDNNFFGSFNNWWMSTDYVQGTIAYKHAQLLMSGALLFASNMPRIVDANGNAMGDVPMTRIVMEQRACGSIVDQTIRDMIEDDSEVTILPKALLEADFLAPYKDRFQGSYLTQCRFLDSTSFRLFLSKCFYNMYGDGIRFMCPTGEIEFLLRLLKPTTKLDISEPSKRNARTLNAIINNATKASIEAGRNLARL